MSIEGIKPFEAALKETSIDRETSLEKVMQVLYRSISDLNLQVPEGQRIDKSPGTILFGEGGRLDSLGLANFIVIVEQHVEDVMGSRIDLTAEDPFSPAAGHFRTIHSLACYISELASRGRESAL
jgi:hypothetical protein